MKLTILGSGTSAMKVGRACCAYHIATPQLSIGFDIGSGILQRYLECGIDPFGIDILIISHFQHPDHVTDLPMLLFANNYNLGNVRRKNLQVIGPNGLSEFYEKILQLFPQAKPKHYEVQLLEVEDGSVYDRFDVSINFAKMSHGTVPTVGARFECKTSTGKFALPSDTAFCENLLSLISGCDLAVLHGAVVDGLIDAPSHLNARDLGRAAASTGCPRVVCSHIYPIGTKEEYLRQIRESFSGEVDFAEDRQVYDL